MFIAPKMVVELYYKLTDDQGNMIDEANSARPFLYIHGLSQIIPGLENQLTGKKSGDALKVNINPEDAYGTRDESLVMAVNKTEFGSPAEIKVGMHIEIETEQGANVAVVKNITDAQIVLDLNHPLAGKSLHFDVKVQSIRAATAEEISHGHVHGPHGHHHH